MNYAAPIEIQQLRTGAARQSAWTAVLSFALVLAIVSGGSSQANSLAFLALRLLCIAILAIALVRLLSVRLTLHETLAVVLLIAGVCLVGLQLVPLPYGLFGSLPGREFVTTAFSVAGIPPQWMPLTLSPEATRSCLLALLPPIAIFIATLTSDARTRWMMVAAILAGTFANVMLGLVQRFLGAKSGLFLYGSGTGSATGFFSNRNNFAMLLCVAIPLTWAVTHKLIRMRKVAAPAAIAGGGVMMAIIFMGLAAAGSRSGILFGMLALALSTAMVLSAPAGSRSSRRTRMSVLALLGGALIIGQFGMTGILRIAGTDPMTEYRTLISRVSLRTAADYFPVGSGFGTFLPVYGMHETPETMMNTYVNHAHNDWLELWIEGGVPAAALMACFVALFAAQALRIWNPKGAYAASVLPRAASVGALVLLLHSLVEFPLRMPALACIFAALIAMMMAAPPPRQQAPGRRRRVRDEDPLDETPAPAVTLAPPVFRVERPARSQDRRYKA